MTNFKKILHSCKLRVSKYRWDVYTAIIILIMALINVVGITKNYSPNLIPPGYYENNLLEQAERAGNLRDNLVKRKQSLREGLLSGSHSQGEIATYIFDLNLTELRYIRYWRAISPFVIGMTKPLENNHIAYWYMDIDKEARDILTEIATELHNSLPKLASCEADLLKENKIISDGLHSRNSDEISEAQIYLIKSIIKNLSNPDKVNEIACDDILISYITSIHKWAIIYPQLDDASERFHSKMELLERAVNAILLILLAIVSYRSRIHWMKLATKPFGL
ncbi:hypothetical protein ACXD9I_003626 [Yersinia enterocolitica]